MENELQTVCSLAVQLLLLKAIQIQIYKKTTLKLFAEFTTKFNHMKLNFLVSQHAMGLHLYALDFSMGFTL